ncbi:MAG: tricarballylate utilization 4Fe-4S protein TcuB [Burkholderiales bacterium]|nr:tricarballylate utilization 4Fe-4S protein TcuB [Burkholderiales bacterium]
MGAGGQPVSPSAAFNALPLTEAEGEVARQMQICNACRYCEGACAVFPAMTRRLEFGKADVHYLANLCHNCGACLHACQYAPPHEFAINVPKAMAVVRGQTYSDYAFPRALGALYRHNGLLVSLATGGGLALFLALAVVLKGGLWHEPLAGNFYAVFPHNLMVVTFGSVFGFAMLALAIGVVRFWRDVSPGEVPEGGNAPAAAEAFQNALKLKYLDGGHGEGCHNEDDRFNTTRRLYHHFTFYGFMLCFASTSVATIYHYAFGWQAPYGYTSLPVILGTVGGIGLLIGPVGLWRLKTQRHPMHGDDAQNTMDYGFLALLFLVSLTGLVLMVLRDTGAMGLLLAIHLGVVMALFITLPYGKFAHGIFRSAALLKWSIERRLPSRLRLGSD